MLFFKPQHYLLQHLQAALSCLGRMYRTPFASLLTIGVIAISLALPVGLLVGLQNSNNLISAWETSPKISLFLKMKLPNEQVSALQQQLQEHPEIDHTKLLSPEAGLKRMQEDADFTDVLKELPENPLPPVIEVYPKINAQNTEGLRMLEVWLKQLPHVDVVQFNLQWVQRLQSIVHFSEVSLILLFILLAVSVLLVIANSLRILIQQYQQEMTVMKLIGATQAFIRRPFLYSGFFYGFFGAVCAWLLIMISLYVIQFPLQRIVELYHSQFQLHGLDFKMTLLMLLGTGVWGVLSAMFSLRGQ